LYPTFLFYAVDLFYQLRSTISQAGLRFWRLQSPSFLFVAPRPLFLPPTEDESPTPAFIAFGTGLSCPLFSGWTSAEFLSHLFLPCFSFGSRVFDVFRTMEPGFDSPWMLHDGPAWSESACPFPVSRVSAFSPLYQQNLSAPRPGPCEYETFRHHEFFFGIVTPLV